MRTLILAAVILGSLSAFPSAARADERATTAELPAALQALGVEPSRIATVQEAEKVRGEHFVGNLQFTIITPGFATQFQFSGAANAFSAVIQANSTSATFAFGLR